ncbi:MAG TPA: GNAT family N-acetyltransferase [Chthonomonadaceae bacterium]|nr:GNAT family N-acetyltransferase [Chthonomonadaceae bacterium]
MSNTHAQASLSPGWEAKQAELLLRLQALPPMDAPIHKPPATLRIVQATAAESLRVLQIMQSSFAEYRGVLDPPSGVETETVADVEQALTEGGNLLAWEGVNAVASARFRLTPDYLYVGRLAVLPDQRGRGIASALMRYMETIASATARPEIALGTRMRLSQNIALYRKLGYEITKTQQHPRGTDIIVWLVKRLPPSP